MITQDCLLYVQCCPLSIILIISPVCTSCWPALEIIPTLCYYNPLTALVEQENISTTDVVLHYCVDE